MDALDRWLGKEPSLEPEEELTEAERFMQGLDALAEESAARGDPHWLPPGRDVGRGSRAARRRAPGSDEEGTMSTEPEHEHDETEATEEPEETEATEEPEEPEDFIRERAQRRTSRVTQSAFQQPVIETPEEARARFGGLVSQGGRSRALPGAPLPSPDQVIRDSRRGGGSWRRLF